MIEDERGWIKVGDAWTCRLSNKFVVSIRGFVGAYEMEVMLYSKKIASATFYVLHDSGFEPAKKAALKIAEAVAEVNMI